MKQGDTVSAREELARSVILPTHLPQNRLAAEQLLNFQAEDDVEIGKGWEKTYVLSVTCRSLADDKTIHEEGIKLASQQNESRPLKEVDHGKDYGHKRHYMGFYSFKPSCLDGSLQNSEAFDIIFWPEGDYQSHANACMRFSSEVDKRSRTTRRVTLIGLLWRQLNGPVRFTHRDANPHHSFLNDIELDDLPPT